MCHYTVQNYSFHNTCVSVSLCPQLNLSTKSCIVFHLTKEVYYLSDNLVQEISIKYMTETFTFCQIFYKL